MAKQFFKDLPDTSTPLNASRLNGLLDGEEAMGNIVVDSIRSKNMWKPILLGNQYNCNVSLSGDTYIFSATGTDMFYGNVATTTGTSYATEMGQLFAVKPNTSYTLTLSNTNFKKNYVTYYNSSKNTLSYEKYENNSFTFTTPNNCYYISIRVGNGSATSGTTYTTTIQLEQGSTATTYSLYQNLNEQDTGWVDLQILKGTWDIAKVRRIGNICEIYAYSSSHGATAEPKFKLPNGFIPKENIQIYGFDGWVSKPTIARWYINNEGYVGLEWVLSLTDGTSVTENTWKRINAIYFVN